jgi:tetratricopeptide (TPR) repeat protein
MKKIICVLSLVIALFLPATALSKTVVMVDSERQFALAESLFAEEDYLASANEYIRFFHLFADDERVEQARYKTGLAYFYAGQYPDAQRHFQKIMDQFSDSGFAPDAMFKLSELYAVTNRPAMAVATLKNLVVLTRDREVRDTACFMLGWLLMDKAEDLEAGSDFKIFPLKEAKKYFSMISMEGRQKYPIEDTLAALSEKDLVEKKNPTLAGIFAIIPGGGLLYCERYQDALVSFLLNSALMYASYTSFEHDNPALGGVLAFVETGFYTGNIYGSVSGAHKFNKNKREDFIYQIKKDYQGRKNKISLGPGLMKDGLALAFRYEF